MRRIGLAIGLALGVALGVAPSDAFAADPTEIPEVKLTRRGPESTFPLDKPFYVSGEVPKPADGESISEVYAVFVRYWWGAWSLPPSGRAPRSCVEVEAALEGRTPHYNALQTQSPAADTLFTDFVEPGHSPSAADLQHYRWIENVGRVLVARGVVEKGRFQAFANEPSFFHYGARYCVFVYAASRKTTQSIRDSFFAQVHADASPCFAKPKPGACIDEKVIAGIETFEKALGQAIDDPKLKNAVKTALRTNVAGAFRQVVVGADQLRDSRSGWPEPTLARARGLADAREIELSLDDPSKADPDAGFARLTLELLARKGTVSRYTEKHDGVPQTYYGIPGKFEIHAVKFIAGKDDQITSIELLGPPGKSGKSGKSGKKKGADTPPERASQTVAVALAKLDYPELSGISLEDVRALAAGQRPPGLEAAESVAVSLLGDAGSTAKAIANKAKITAALAAAQPRVELRSRIEAAAAGNALTQADRELVAWITSLCKDVSGCKGWQLPWLATLVDVGEALTTLDDNLGTLAESTDELIAETEDYVTKRVALSPEISPTLALSPKAHFDQYVSGYLGMTVSQYATGELALLPVAGAHLFLWPNELTEPMWSNRAADLRRLLGLEYGVRIASGNFGPDDRYRGIVDGNLPVMFLGGVLQPLPYVFVSAGAMFSSYRRSIVAQERYQPRVGWYVGITVDGNLAGIIRTLIGNKGAAASPSPS